MSNKSKQSAKQSNREKNAKKFLYVMLLFITAFVIVVCVFVNKKNGEYIAQKSDSSQPQIAETGNTIPVAATTKPQAPATSEATTKETETTETTSETTETTETTKATNPKGTFFNPIIVSDFSSDTVVVNRNYRLPEGYSPERTSVGNGQTMRTDAAEWYTKMYNAGLEDGVELTPFSGYRSYDTQTTLYNNKVAVMEGQGYSGDEAEIQAATIVMVPGSSEHNLGLAMDIVCCDTWFENTAEYKWLVENAEDYGFILRYPKDKQDITKVIYEPWHWRYVGVETAKKINESGLVMEEYYRKSAQ